MPFELNPEEQERIHVLEKDKDIYKPIISLEELEAICSDNEVLKELLDEMLDQCLKYTITVAEFVELEEMRKTNPDMANDLLEKGESRGIIHDATIDSINIFSRALVKSGKDNSWMKDIVINRPAYGRFALTLTLSRIH